MGRLIYLKNVTTLNLVETKCIGCGMCLSVCPHAVLSMTNGRVAIWNRDACMECGACSQNCPTMALSVRPGVGCTAAVINAALERKSSSSCCTVASENLSECSSEPNRPKCC